MPQNANLIAAVERHAWVHMGDLLHRGGPTDADRERGRLMNAQVCHDRWLYEEYAERDRDSSAIAFAIAVLSFHPGGVRVFGKHYDCTGGAVVIDTDPLSRYQNQLT